MKRLLILAALLLALPAWAGTAKLQWDPVTDADLAGYKVAWWVQFSPPCGGGSPPGNATIVDVPGPVTTKELFGLPDCQNLCFMVQAYDQAQQAGPWSTPVDQWSRPEIGTVDPASAQQGQTVTLAVSGNNFAPGATVSISNPGVTVNTVEVLACDALGLTVTVSPTADTGSWNLEVVNPEMATGEGRIYGVGTAVFTVVADTTPPAQPQNLRRVFRK